LYFVLLLNFARVTDYLYHAFVKDPVRHAPAGNVIVSPADGTILYVREISDGIIPMVVKEGISVPMAEHLKTELLRPFKKGYLIGIYMNTQGVHVSRVPNNGTIIAQHIYNGPHMDMTSAETEIILSQLIPGVVSFKKILGIEPFNLTDKGDYILKSARETLTLEDETGHLVYIVRIADYYVGKILTWVHVGEKVERGQKLGMIVWGSQTDIFIEDRPGLKVTADVGEYVYGAESILAIYE
jgi:phosphatidylserine decarboxylase